MQLENCWITSNSFVLESLHLKYFNSVVFLRKFDAVGNNKFMFFAYLACDVQLLIFDESFEMFLEIYP